VSWSLGPRVLSHGALVRHQTKNMVSTPFQFLAAFPLDSDDQAHAADGSLPESMVSPSFSSGFPSLRTCQAGQTNSGEASYA
jgi:hypothetical protein